MNPHVDRQLAALVEASPALVAAVRLVLLVLSVSPHVVPDVALKDVDEKCLMN